MSDREPLAARAVLEKAILEVLAGPYEDTLSEARAEYDSGDSDTVRVGGAVFGRVRRNRESKPRYRIVDPVAFFRWVEAHAPLQIVEVVSKAFEAEVLRTGVWIDPRTGEAVDVDGVELGAPSPGALVVEPADAATDWARAFLRGDPAARAIGAQRVPELGAGE